MDRNTLIAFLLISIILICTPYYLELVSPKNGTSQPEPQGFNNDEFESSVEDSLTNTTAKTAFNSESSLRTVSTHKEKLTKVETPLYRSTISSKGGGSIISFETYEYLTGDSLYVNLVKSENPLNLTPEVKDLDGNDVDLYGAWVLTSPEPSYIIKEPTELTYRLELFKDRFVYKKITLYPDSYQINIELDLTDIKSEVLRDAWFGWHGGLPTTEKSQDEDLSYFKAHLYQGGELEELKLNKGGQDQKTYNGSVDWVAVRTKYFTAALMSDEPVKVRSGKLWGNHMNQETYNASLCFDVTDVASFVLYLGPLEYNRIKSLSVNLESIMDFGWMFIRPISKGVLVVLKWLNQYISNYGVVLIIFSFLVKALVYPLTKKSYQSTTAMQSVQPELNSLRDKYKNNPQKLNQATMNLYKEKGINPLGGCLPMLLQMPLLFALFIVFRTTIELRAEPFIWWISDLSSPDVLFYLPFKIPIYGGHVAGLPILMVISMYVQQKMMTGGAQQAQQKMMQYFMTGFFFLIFNSFPSGLNLYYTLFNILTIAQQKLLPPKIRPNINK